MHPSRRLTPFLFVLPLLALLAFVFGYPVVRIFEFSFKMVRGVDGPWIGTRNYELVLNHPLFWESVTHNLMLLAAIPAMVVLALLISIVLYERIRGWKIYRVILFLPFVLAVPIIAVVLKKMFQFSGPVNQVLHWLSLDFLALDWIGSTDVALWTRDPGHHLARVRARHHPLSRAAAEPRRIPDRGRKDRRRQLVAARLVRDPCRR